MPTRKCHVPLFGDIVLEALDGALVAMHVVRRAAGDSDSFASLVPIVSVTSRDDGVLALAERQLREYLSGRRRTFDLPLAPRGTAFRQRVWKALCAIPYGETRSYGEIARAIGCPRGYRAVGGANHANPLPVFIPCHRVLAGDGTIGGYGLGLEVKMALLTLERDTLAKQAGSSLGD